MIQPHPRLAAWNLQVQCPAVILVIIPVSLFPGIPLAPILSDSLHNSSVSVPSAPIPNDSLRSYPKQVPERKKSENEVSAIATGAAHQQLLSPQLLPRNVG